MASEEPRYRIGAVARLTGVSTHALRVWERRYGTVQPFRSEAGDRLYSEADVQRLRLIKRLLGMGHAIGELGKLSDDELGHLLELHVSGTPAAVGGGALERYIACLERMDVEGADRLLSSAALSLGRRDFMDRILVPLMHEVGRRWQSGELGVAHEHAATAMVRTHLGALLALFSADPDAPSALTTTPAGELHEIGALMAALLARMAGWRAVHLGPNLPAAEIARGAREAAADAVLVSVVALEPGRAAAELSDIARSVAPHTAIVVGGAAAQLVPEVPARILRLSTLAELDLWLTSRIGVRVA